MRFLALVLASALLASPAAAQSARSVDRWTFAPTTDFRFGINDFLRHDWSGPMPAGACRLSGETIAALPAGSAQDYTVHPSIVARVSEHLQLGQNWYARQGFGVPSRRPVGPLVPPHPDAGQLTNYFACMDRLTGYLQTTSCVTRGFEDNSLLEVGVEMNKMVLAGSVPAIAMGAVHEYGHIMQFDYVETVPERCNSPYFQWPPATWVTEGLVDGLAVLYAWDTFRQTQIYTQPFGGTGRSAKFLKRFFLLRPYYLPLHWHRFGEVKADGRVGYFNTGVTKQIGYRTNGFWVHLAERYLGGDLSQFSALLGLQPQASSSVRRSLINRVDRFIDDRDGGRLSGLEHVFPQFLAELAQWHKHRFEGQLSKASADLDAFDGCETLTLTDAAPTGTLSLDLPKVAGKCVEITVASAATEATLSAMSFGAGDIADAFYLALAETTGLQRDFDCYTAMSRGDPRAGPCVFSGATQGRVASGPLQRYMSHPLPAATPGQPITLRLIAANVPGALEPPQRGPLQKDTFTIVFALENAVMAGRPARAGYARKRGPGSPVRGDQPSGGLDDALVGAVDPLRPIEDALSPAEASLSCADEQRRPSFWLTGLGAPDPSGMGWDEGDDTLTVTIAPGASYAPGSTGRFTAIAAGQIDGVDYAPGALTPSSSVTITRNDAQAILFQASAHLCAVPPGGGAEAARLYGQGGGCRTQERRVSIQGSVAFPRASECGAQPERVATPALNRLNDIRLARISDSLPGLVPSAGAPSQAPSQSGGSGGGGTVDGAACPATAAAGCDCSCALQQCIASGATQATAGCRLACASAFRQCPN